MATIMEKDVLLELARGALALTQGLGNGDEVEADRNAMGTLWAEIMDTNYQKIDYDAMLKRVKALRAKYERD
ncbi:MAG: hypothetical protein JW802_02345 [Campylobacterales bacterium]|nr:hypothetical protein [Campylobacterales bacterium]MBN2831826.1 hypothetical protein [Campylobacterales bacterium]